MRIALLVAQSPDGYGGVERVAVRLGGQLAVLGHDVDLLVQTCSHQVLETVPDPRLRVTAFPVPRRCLAVPLAPALIVHLATHARDYDVLHTHNYHALPALLAACARPRRLVFSPYYHGSGHSRWKSALHRPYRLAGAWMIRAADAVVCSSRAERALLRAHFGLSSTRSRLIPPGVDLQPLRAAAPLPQRRPALLSVGRLEHYKGVERLLAAMPMLAQALDLHIVGSGPARASLERLARALHVDQHVVFHGSLDEQTLRRWRRTARVSVSLSAKESYALTVLEALAAGARVVASDIPAHREQQYCAADNALTFVPLQATPATIASAVRRAAALPAPGLAPACCFPSWEAAALALVQIYEGRPC